MARRRSRPPTRIDYGATRLLNELIDTTTIDPALTAAAEQTGRIMAADFDLAVQEFQRNALQPDANGNIQIMLQPDVHTGQRNQDHIVDAARYADNPQGAGPGDPGLQGEPGTPGEPGLTPITGIYPGDPEYGGLPGDNVIVIVEVSVVDRNGTVSSKKGHRSARISNMDPIGSERIKNRIAAIFCEELLSMGFRTIGEPVIEVLQRAPERGDRIAVRRWNAPEPRDTPATEGRPYGEAWGPAPTYTDTFISRSFKPKDEDTDIKHCENCWWYENCKSNNKLRLPYCKGQG